MENFFKELDKIIFESNEKINQKILGINYLEKLKFFLIEKINDLKIDSYEKIENFEKVKEYRNINLSIKFNNYVEAFSKIKNTLPNDNLSIVLKGLKTFDIYDSKVSKKFNLFQNMGIVLPKQLIVSESITKKSTIIDIFILNENLGIEK